MTEKPPSSYRREPYARVIIPDEEGGYAAEVLEFPGCFSDGESLEDAYANLEEAAGNWIDSAREQGMRIPAPFATQGSSGTISLRLPRSLHRRATLLACRDGISLNQAFVAAIAAWVGAREVGDALASKLDERLDQLQSPQVLLINDPGFGSSVESEAPTPNTTAEEDETLAWVKNVDVSNIRQSATTSQSATRVTIEREVK